MLTNWWPLGSGFDDTVYTLLASGDNLYAGGYFRRAGDLAVSKVALWNGLTWVSLGGGVSDEWGNGGCVLGMALNGSDLFVGGSDLYQAGGVNVTNIARWDGATWIALGSGIQVRPASTVVGSLAATGSELIVGGRFYVVGGKSSTNIALWHIPYALLTSRTGNVLTLSWPATGTNFVLETTDNLPATNWSEVLPPPVVHDSQCIVTNEIFGYQRFYRLRRR